MPERPGRWDLLDRQSDPVVADSAEIDVQLTHFRSLADMLRIEGQRLARIGSGESLRGAYANELRAASSDVANDLNKAVGRYDAVVHALAEFRPAVDVALAGSAAALDDAIDAIGAKSSADGIPLATATPGTELTTDQQQANDDKLSATHAATGRLQAAKTRLSEVLTRFDDAGRQAARTVRAGFNDGLKDSGWDRFKYAFAKFLKIFVEILAIIGMVLAVIALIIPGIGPLIAAALMTIATVLEGIVFVSEVALVALGEGSWVDIGLSVASFLTFGGAKTIGTAAKRAHRSATTTQRPDPGDYLELGDISPTASRAGSPGGNPAPEMPVPPTQPGPARSATPPSPDQIELRNAHEWNVPAGSVKTDHPDDLGVNTQFIQPGTHSWLSPTGVRYTRLTNWVGYKGITTEGGESMLRDGAKFLESQEPRGNGNPVKDWKAFYATDDIKGAQAYAGEMDDDTLHPGGTVLRYENSRDVTLVQPANEIRLQTPDPENPGQTTRRDVADVTQEARALFPEHNPDLPLTDGLGDNNMIMRYPLWDTTQAAERVDSELLNTFEYLVPWSVSEKGSLTVAGRMIPHDPPKKFAEPTWVAAP